MQVDLYLFGHVILGYVVHRLVIIIIIIALARSQFCNVSRLRTVDYYCRTVIAANTII